MALARSVLERLKSSDGRIRVKTLSGVSALVAAIALLVGVLPVMADHDPAGPLVPGIVVNYGGGAGACAATLDGRLPSAASKEFHINNPQPGSTFTQDGITVFNIRDRAGSPGVPAGRVFDFKVSGTSGFVVYDVIVNGGAQNNHYDYDTTYPDITPPGPVDHDNNLSAPEKNKKSLYNLSHINICYDVPGVTLFVCGAEEPVSATRFGGDVGDFTGATAQVFTIDGETECQKRGSFFIEDDFETTLDFGIGTGTVAGRADFFKQFDSGAAITDLIYDGGPATGFEPVPWCSTDGGPHAEFGEIDETPNSPTGGHTACKVYEQEDATGFQHTVVYFEFEDPKFQ